MDASRWAGAMSQEKKRLRLAVLISGSGRTLKNFIDLSAADKLPVEISLVLSSNSEAGGLEYARDAGIDSQVFLRSKYDTDDAYGQAMFDACRQAQVDYVAMAGFLKLAPVPDDFIGCVLNIHPSLIPSFCGQGMYGHHVHQAVLESGVKVTGVTVHFVDNQYDRGPIIWQQPIPVFEDDSVDSLAKRVFAAEKEAYPNVLRQLAAGRIRLEDGRVRGL